MNFLTENDLNQISELGIRPEKIDEDLRRFRHGFPYTKLVRPCTPGDGIKTMLPEEKPDFTKKFETAAAMGRFIKFVPASGAATRMFAFLQSALNTGQEISRHSLGSVRDPSPDTILLKQFTDQIRTFPFIDDLTNVLERKNIQLEEEIRLDRYNAVIECLLGSDGLNYAQRPKALILFHKYPEAARTAFEEHLVEAIHTVTDRNGSVAIHFTISPEHRHDFDRLISEKINLYQKAVRKFDITFSVQLPSTQTIAVDDQLQPFRDTSGRLVFRPAGHGTLIDNLDQLEGDLVFIKNIDNIAPDHLKGMTYQYKKLLAGYLIDIQNTVHFYLNKLENDIFSRKDIDECTEWINSVLRIPLPDLNETPDPSAKISLLRDILHRPIRVCGMVKNAGEPGGGPFWTVSQKGLVSRQIVEKHQVNMLDSEQKRIWESSTHFNPVDLVCGLKDHHGNNYSLKQFIDPDTGFISVKSKDGKSLRALEVPGLWNGAMAEWITLFAEVPLITFNPVKTINDLLRPEHQTQQ